MMGGAQRSLLEKVSGSGQAFESARDVPKLPKPEYHPDQLNQALAPWD